ncbi:hypothetical protein [Bradyrhizobium sp. sGM-13]|uniref:hypothetical protein n=1 Tax=Bradyrhizobium sp. sGM-13 TaxID=2831781 RepID=UPI001BCC8A61|nr:hypothetical protein [Bradyrhizobium sp. sGM-13]
MENCLVDPNTPEERAMTTRFKIHRDRWSLEEVWEKEGDRPGRGAFALVLDDEHFPYFRYPQSRHIADALTEAAKGQDTKPVALQDATIQIRPAPNGAVQITTPAGRECQLSINEARQLARDLIEPLAQTLSGPPD